MLRRTIGIDLAIRGEQVAQIFDDGQAQGKALRFRLNAEQLQHFVDTATAGVAPGVPIQAIMEPTGMAWFPLAHWLQRAGVEVIRVKGQRVKALRRYLSEHAKTDIADAHVLGAIPHFGGRRFDAVHGECPKNCVTALKRLIWRDRERADERRGRHPSQD